MRFLRAALLLLGFPLALATCVDKTGVDGSPAPIVKLHLQFSLGTSPITTVVVEVTASDIPQLLAFNLTVSGTTASGTISLPAGSARTITVRAYDAKGIETHRGSITIDVVNGVNPTVSIQLMPLGSDVPITVAIGSWSIAVSPISTSVAVGATVGLSASISDGVQTVNAQPQWASLNPSIATVSASGVVTGVLAGSVTIVATYGGVGAASTVMVTGGTGVGSAAKLAFMSSPTNTTAGLPFAPSIQVSVLDASGNLVTNATNVIRLGITNNVGGGALGGVVSVSAVGGVATFPGVSIDKVGAGYRIGAIALGLTPIESSAFDVVAAGAVALLFEVQPSTTSLGATITPPVQVVARDAFGNVATGFSGRVALAIGTNPPGIAILSGDTAINATRGIVTSSNLNINREGTGYTLTATSPGLARATSTSFTILCSGCQALPDLIVSDITIGNWDAATGTVTMTYTFKNVGNSDATLRPSVNFSLCLSTDGITADQPNCESGVSGTLGTTQAVLAPGATEAISETFPALNAGESFYIIVTVDSKNALVESNENNNRLVSSSKLVSWTTPMPACLVQQEIDLVNVVNQARANVGQPALAVDTRLVQTARMNAIRQRDGIGWANLESGSTYGLLAHYFEAAYGSRSAADVWAAWSLDANPTRLIVQAAILGPTVHLIGSGYDTAPASGSVYSPVPRWDIAVTTTDIPANFIGSCTP